MQRHDRKTNTPAARKNEARAQRDRERLPRRSNSSCSSLCAAPSKKKSNIKSAATVAVNSVGSCGGEKKFAEYEAKKQGNARHKNAKMMLTNAQLGR